MRPFVTLALLVLVGACEDPPPLPTKKNNGNANPFPTYSPGGNYTVAPTAIPTIGGNFYRLKSINVSGQMLSVIAGEVRCKFTQNGSTEVREECLPGTATLSNNSQLNSCGSNTTYTISSGGQVTGVLPGLSNPNCVSPSSPGANLSSIISVSNSMVTVSSTTNGQTQTVTLEAAL